MLQTLDRYILRQVIVTSAAMIGIALAVLLLERLLRVLERAVNADEVVGYVSRMLIALVPHYLGIALPLAFFLAVMLTFNRLSRDNEFAVMTAAGVGLRRLMAPVAGLALVLVVVIWWFAAAVLKDDEPYQDFPDDGERTKETN